MKVVGLCGFSGAGKTQLAEGLVILLKQAGCTVSVVKHTHKDFDVDRPGKDSFRHRAAGAFEVVVANRHRVVLIREYGTEAGPGVHDLLAELTDLGPHHWVLVEGFKHADLPKIEVWRPVTGARALYPDDAHVVAVATTGRLPQPAALPVLDLDEPAAVAAFLLQDPARFDYRRPDAHRDA